MCNEGSLTTSTAICIWHGQVVNMDLREQLSVLDWGRKNTLNLKQVYLPCDYMGLSSYQTELFADYVRILFSTKRSILDFFYLIPFH